jgi:hypothetical protein
MKKLIHIFTAILFIAFVGSCESAKKAYENGRYDKAIQLAAKKLRKKPDDQKTIEVLVNSWEISNRVDKEDLNRQLTGSNPDWEQVFNLYKKLDARQRIVMQLPKLKPDNHRTNVDFQFEDYTAALDDAKQHAIEKLIKEGDGMMAMGDRFNARKAYDTYNKAFGYDPYNTSIKEKMDQSKLAGLTHILVQIAPAGQVSLPENFIRQALDKKWSALESTWTRIHTNYQANFTYHYYADVLLNQVTVSPEKVAETSFVETQKIEDGWEYARNQDGSYKTDTLGNKIKVTVYKDVSCTVKKITQSKETNMNGTVIIYGIDSDKKYCNDNISGSFTFVNVYATAKGDSRALSKTSQDLIGKKEMAYPTNADMLMNVCPNLGNAIYDKVNQYKSSFQ